MSDILYPALSSFCLNGFSYNNPLNYAAEMWKSFWKHRCYKIGDIMPSLMLSCYNFFNYTCIRGMKICLILIFVVYSSFVTIHAILCFWSVVVLPDIVFTICIVSSLLIGFWIYNIIRQLRIMLFSKVLIILLRSCYRSGLWRII